MDNDVEVVQRKRYQPCTKHFDGWRLPDGTQLFQWGCCYRSIDSLPDPLADTPEGVWEFMQVMKWADKWCTERDAFWDLTSGVLLDDEETWGYEMVIFMPDETTYSAKHADERTARIAALAAAVRHEKGTEQ